MPTPGDGQVESYERVVNGQRIKVNAYAKKSTTTTRAAAEVRKRPGRPRMAGSPGSYSSGRDIPGMKAVPVPEVPVIEAPEQKGHPDDEAGK